MGEGGYGIFLRISNNFNKLLNNRIFMIYLMTVYAKTKISFVYLGLNGEPGSVSMRFVERRKLFITKSDKGLVLRSRLSFSDPNTATFNMRQDGNTFNIESFTTVGSIFRPNTSSLEVTETLAEENEEMRFNISMYYYL